MQQRIVTLVGLATLVIGLGASSMAQQFLTPQKVYTERGIRYVSGGVGEAERAALRQMTEDYSLKLVFAVQQGNALADVNVAIKDSQGTPVLDTVIQGPWLYVDLPPGKYTVVASAYNQAKEQMAQVSEPGQSELQFTWNAPPAADGLGTRGGAPRR
jgi:hypothetical protein